MTFWRLVSDNLRHYWRTNLQVLLGTALASGVLIGALAVGDSVRFSLRQLARNRLGQIDYALTGGDRFFRQQLAADWQRQIGDRTMASSPLLQVRGVGVAEGGIRRANQVQVYGVEHSFWQLAAQPAALPALEPDEAVVNRRLAAQLQLKAGDEFLLRLEKPRLMPSDTPLASDQNVSTAWRVRVKAVLADEALGAFSLRAEQLVPFNAFVSLPWLARKTDLTNRANLVVLAGLPGDARPRLESALKRGWQLADASLELRKLPRSQEWELRSERVFLDPPVTDAVRSLLDTNRPSLPDRPISTGAVSVLSYFVNEIRSGTNVTPYSIVAGTQPPLLPADLADDHILINQWLADDLRAKPGDPVELKYYAMGPMRQLQVTSAVFRVQGIVPSNAQCQDPELMPHFPGLADAASCRDWDPGVPIDLAAIRKQDEAYWDAFRGTPKALVNLSVAQRLWGNRFGNLTAIRFSLTNSVHAPSTLERDATTATESPHPMLTQAILDKLDPASMGLQLQEVRQTAERASQASVDFGQLFLGLSFFLVMAALLLTALLFALGVEQRREEIGTLRALGFRPAEIRRIFLLEAWWLVLPGTLLGCGLGMGYTRLILWGLDSLWKGAVGGVPLRYDAQGFTLLIGMLASALVAGLAISGVVRRLTNRAIRELQGGLRPIAIRPTQRHWGWILAAVCVVGALTLLGLAGASPGRKAVGLFFGAGSLMLTGLLLAVGSRLRQMAWQPSLRSLGWTSLSLRSCSRRTGRSVAVAASLACGVFLVLAVAANRHDPAAEPRQRTSGTGGFLYYGETSLPVLHDLNTETGRKYYALDPDQLTGVRFVMGRLREGDDASCLNLNRAQQPPVLGLDPQALSSRGAFSFVSLVPGVDPQKPWTALDLEFDDHTIPAVADQTVITWGLGKNLGDTLSYRDEQGRDLKIKLVGGLANSILQGRIVISEQAFTRCFPSLSGARILLIDAPSDPAKTLAERLSFSLQDVGLELVRTEDRLREFNQVENTYLSIFLVLGGLGVALGSIGLGVVVMRNVLERRSELAVMRALGFRRRQLRWLVFTEHFFIQCVGALCGGIAALVAIWPVLRTPGTVVPWDQIGIVLAIILITGVLWTLAATYWATLHSFLDALRDE